MTGKMTKELLDRFKELGFSTMEIETIEGEWNPPAPQEKEEKVARSSSAKKSTEGLDEIMEVIREKFDVDEDFANKDLFPEIEKLGYTNRQTPSRLKALAEKGDLVEVPGHSPKRYKLA